LPQPFDVGRIERLDRRVSRLDAVEPHLQPLQRTVQGPARDCYQYSRFVQRDEGVLLRLAAIGVPFERIGEGLCGQERLPFGDRPEVVVQRAPNRGDGSSVTLSTEGLPPPLEPYRHHQRASLGRGEGRRFISALVATVFGSSWASVGVRRPGSTRRRAPSLRLMCHL
jgi:hypothetical protein